MIIIAGTIQIDPQKREANLAAIQVMMAKSQAEEGCLAYEFSADLTTPNQFHLFEIWESEQSLQAHRESSHMATFRQETFPTFVQTQIKRYSAQELR